MKNLGWNLFIALLLGNIVAVVMLRLAVKLKIVVTIGAIVFVLLALVLFLGSYFRERSKKRDAAKIAQLQEQVDNSQKKDEPAE